MNKPAEANNYFHQVALKASFDAIPQLNKDNYSIWRNKMMMLFNLKDIKEVMTVNVGQLPIKQD